MKSRYIRLNLISDLLIGCLEEEELHESHERLTYKHIAKGRDCVNASLAVGNAIEKDSKALTCILMPHIIRPGQTLSLPYIQILNL